MEIKMESTEIGVQIETEKVYPGLENLIITPSEEEQHFKSEKYGYDNVTVKKIESDTIIVEPTTDEQTFDGLYNRVIVNKIETEEKVATLDFSNSDVNEIIPAEGIYLKKVIINKDVNKLPENIVKNVVIDGIVGSFEGGGTIEGVKQFTTVEEMNADTTVKERDLAIVYNYSSVRVTQNTIYKSLYLPKKIILSSTISGFSNYTIYFSEGNTNRSSHFVKISRTYIKFYKPSLMGTEVTTVSYASSDGKNYTRNDNNENDIVMTVAEIYEGEYSEIILGGNNFTYAYEILRGIKHNGSLYIYEGGEWVLLTL